MANDAPCPAPPSGDCPPSESLEHLLAGSLPEGQVAAARAHLAACAACQAVLDRLSDDAELRGWAAPLRQPAAVPPEESGLVRRLERLGETPAERTTGGGPRGPGLPPGFLGPPARAGDLGTLDHYQVEGVLGRGGMGTVLKAHDATLRRTVALKVLDAGRAGPEGGERFVREARAAAGIEHDNVVTVHEVRSPAAGPPYLVMEYVAGPTLRELIRGEGRLDPRRAAEVCAQVADGLAAAHARGLVHRDIKPANVILDAGGRRAKIVDFGLARLTDPADGVTREETLPGTPEYMSPEQARGEPLDGRSDVYGLGVTLYEALTGEVPFRGVPHMVLQQVLNDEPPPPRRLNHQVPRDLETVCLKALAREKGRRYPTAAALADDLRRWLRGEPIRARPVGPAGRLLRWCRRQPAVAGLAASLLVGFVALAAATVLLVVARERERQALGDAVRARQRVEAKEAEARDLVDYWFVTVSEDPEMRGTPGTRNLLRKLLDRGGAFYEQRLAQETGTDPEERRQAALAHYRLAGIRRDSGPLTEVLAGYAKARALQEGLRREQPEDPQFAHELALTLTNMALTRRELGQLDEALKTYAEAREIQEELAEDHPGEPDFAFYLARTYNNIGAVYLHRSQGAQAREAFEKARRLQEGLAEKDPKALRVVQDLAASYGNLADALRSEPGGDAREAERWLRTATSLLEGLAAQHPAASTVRDSLAALYSNLGLMQMGRGALGGAFASLMRAKEIQEELFREAPWSADFRLHLARTCNNLGEVTFGQKKVGESREYFQQAVAHFVRLKDDHPDRADYVAGLVGAYYNLATFYGKTGDLAQATDPFLKAAALQEVLVRRDPSQPGPRVALGALYGNVGRLTLATGNPLQSLDWYGKSIKTLEGVPEALRKAQQVREFHRNAYLGRGEAHVKLWQPRQALADLDRAAALDGKVPIRTTRVLRAAALAGLGRHREAVAEAEAVAGEAAGETGLLYELARTFSLASAAAGRDTNLPPGEQAGLADRYAGRAVDFLGKARAAGLFRERDDVQALRTEPDFDAIWAREDFQKLLAELEGAEPPPEAALPRQVPG